MQTEGLFITEATIYKLRMVLGEGGYQLLSRMLAEQKSNNSVAHHFVDGTKAPNTNTKGYKNTQYTHRG